MTMIESPQVYTQTLALRIGLGLVFLLPVGVALAIAFSETEIAQGPLWFAVGFIALYAFIAFAIGKTHIVTTPISIRKETMFGATEIAWDRVAEYRYKILNNTAAGVHGGLIGAAIAHVVEKKRGRANSFQLVLKGSDGGKVAITANYRGAHALRDSVLGHLHPKMLQIARAQLDRQQPVTFGPITLRPDGVSYKAKDPVPLSDISAIDLTSPQLRIKRQGKLFDAISVGSDRVPNVVAFVQLAKESIEKRTLRPLPPDAVKVI